MNSKKCTPELPGYPITGAFLLLLLSASAAFSQNYMVNENKTIDIVQCDRFGEPLGDNLIEKLHSGYKFTVESETNDVYIITIPKFTGSSKNSSRLNEKFVDVDLEKMKTGMRPIVTKEIRKSIREERSMLAEPDSLTDSQIEKIIHDETDRVLDKYISQVDPNIKFFSMKKADLLLATELPSETSVKSGFVYGPLIIPIKVRLPSKRTTFDVTSDVNLGITAGHKFAWIKNDRPNELALIGGVSISSILMDSSTTEGYLKTENKIAALTATIGIVFMKDNFQIGLMLGQDFPSGRVSKDWIYRKVPWIGFGLGVTLFNNNNRATRMRIVNDVD